MVGCLGQVGRGLVEVLARPGDRVIGTDMRRQAEGVLAVPYAVCDVTSRASVREAFERYRPTHVVHLSAILSGAGEKDPRLAMEVNVGGFLNVLEECRARQAQLFSPSTIAAFGPSTPKTRTPDSTTMRPTSVYGITKVHMELMGEYYHRRYGVDFRSLRLPGVISPGPISGTGPTDYAVEIFHKAAAGERFECYLAEDTRLPMIYIQDCLEAIAKLIECPEASLTQRVYNIHGLDFTPGELAAALHKDHRFPVAYRPDFRQAIADSWPHSLEDSHARADWGYAPKVDTIERLVAAMLRPDRPARP